MKTVIVNFAPQGEEFSEIRLTFVTDSFKSQVNYTYVTIAAKSKNAEKVGMETAMNPFTFLDKLRKFELVEDDLQKILDAFKENKYIKSDLEHFAWCGDLTKEEFLEYFYREIEDQAFSGVASTIWYRLHAHDFEEEEEVTIKKIPISHWLYDVLLRNKENDYCALRLDENLDDVGSSDVAVSQYFEDFGFNAYQEDGECYVDVRVHKCDDDE